MSSVPHTLPGGTAGAAPRDARPRFASWPWRAWSAARARLLPFILPLLLLAAWEAAARQGWMPAQILPAPGQVLTALAELAASGEIAVNLRISLGRIAGGFVLGAAAGLGLGILLGVSARARDYLEPTLRASFAVPTMGWIPILMLIFGIEETLKILVIAKAVLVPIVINTAQGIRNIPDTYVETARVLRLGLWSRLRKLYLPAVLPTLFSGVRLALSAAFISLIVVEMLAAAEGIGYMMVWGRTLFQLDIVMVGMIVVGLTGLALDKGLLGVERLLSRGAVRND